MFGPMLRRLALGVTNILVTLLGLVALTFFIGRMLPTDPVISILGELATKESYEALYLKLGLDQPLSVQFLTYLSSVAQFDFGTSLSTGAPVLTDIARVFPATIELATFAIILGAGLGVPLGVVAAMYRDSWIDAAARLIGLVTYSAPNFWLGMMALILFYVTLGWTSGPGRLAVIHDFTHRPVTGFVLLDSAMAGNWDVFRNAFSHIVLPGSVLGLSSMAYISRMTRSFMAEQLNQEYIITARVKGMSWRRVVWVHAFRNALVQILTIVALSYAFLLEGAVLTETVFAWPGFGRYMTNGLLNGDMNAVIGCTILIGLIFITLNLICDALYRILDPRTK